MLKNLKAFSVFIGLSMSLTLVQISLQPLVGAGQVLAAEEVVDQIVDLGETALKDLSEEDRQAKYEALDAIKKSSEDPRTPHDFSQFEELMDEEEYLKFMVSTNEEAKVIYLGYDESDFTKAMTPKLNQLAKEKDLPLYYYNVRRHYRDPNFQNSMTLYRVDKVPHAFLVKNGKVKAKIGPESSMKDIENFLDKAKKG